MVGEHSEKTEAAVYKELAQSIQAEFSNYKKKMAERGREDIEAATGMLVLELLPVLDALELAVGAGIEGVVEIHREVLQILGRGGLIRVEVLGRAFDPAVAEVIGTRGGELVAVEHRGGYLWKGKLLRPAIVEVGEV
jgi:molecular chaperone GrpE